jgi:methylmalonyl-CoA mutase
MPFTMTSYQGGHNEYFKYMYDLLKKEKEQVILKIFFWWRWQVILPSEIAELQTYRLQIENGAKKH